MASFAVVVLQYNSEGGAGLFSVSAAGQVLQGFRGPRQSSGNVSFKDTVF